MIQIKHWQDLVNMLLGLCLAIAPWVMGFDTMTSPTLNAVAAGLALVALAMGALMMPRAWEEWGEAAMGLWMVLSPWILGFGMVRVAMTSTVAIGLAVLALAAWTLATDKDFAPWLHRDKVMH